MEITNTNDALKLMEEYILVSINYKKNILLFTLRDNLVLIQNDNISTKLSKDDFRTLFINEKFAIYKPISECSEINQDYIIYRQ